MIWSSKYLLITPRSVPFGLVSPRIPQAKQRNFSHSIWCLYIDILDTSYTVGVSSN